MRLLRAGEHRNAGCFHQRLLGYALQRPYVWRFISSGVGFRFPSIHETRRPNVRLRSAKVRGAAAHYRLKLRTLAASTWRLSSMSGNSAIFCQREALGFRSTSSTHPTMIDDQGSRDGEETFRQIRCYRLNFARLHSRLVDRSFCAPCSPSDATLIGGPLDGSR